MFGFEQNDVQNLLKLSDKLKTSLDSVNTPVEPIPALTPAGMTIDNKPTTTLPTAVNVPSQESEVDTSSDSSFDMKKTSDAIGSVILISTDVPISDVEDKMCIVLSKLLSKQFVD